MSYTVQSYALHQRIINEINDLKKLDNIFINSDGVLYSDSSCQNVLELPISLELVTLQSIRVLKPVTITLSDINGLEVYRATPLLVDDFNTVHDGDDVVVWEDVLNKPDFDNLYLKQGADNNFMPYNEFRFRYSTFTDPDSGVQRDLKAGDKGIATVSLKLGSASGIVKSVSGVLSASALLATEIPALDASKITTGTFDLARIPALPSSNTVICSTIPTMSAPDQALVAKGTIVIESSTGNTYRYTGSGSVILNSSYILCADVSPDWSVITNRPSNVSYFTNDAGYLTSASNIAWSKISNTPTTLAEYGITDALTTSYVPSWASISGKPNILAGYGIASTDTLFDSKYLQSSSSLDPSKITQTASYRFVTDAEKTTWNGKMNTNGSNAATSVRLATAVESNEILTVQNAGSSILVNSPATGSALRSAIRFNWYSTDWQIGNIRGTSTDSQGFGITLSGGSNLRWRTTNGTTYDYNNLEVTGTIKEGGVLLSSKYLQSSSALNPERITTGYTTNSFYLNTHPEDNGVIIPFINNDIAHLTLRGGAMTSYYTTDSVYTAQSLTNTGAVAIGTTAPFDGTPSYAGLTIGAVSNKVVIDIVCNKTFQYGTILYIDFGASWWRAKNISFFAYMAGASNAETDYKQFGDVSNNGVSRFYCSNSYTYTNTSGGTSQGFNRIRIVLTNWNNTTPRIAAIGVIGYDSKGLSEPYMSRAGGSLYGNILPYTNGTLLFGDSSHKFDNIFSNLFTGNLYGNAETVTRLQTARTIAGVFFDGSANISIPYSNLTGIPSTFTPSTHNHDSVYLSKVAGAIHGAGAYSSTNPTLAIGDGQYGMSSFGGVLNLYSSTGTIAIRSRSGGADAVLLGTVWHSSNLIGTRNEHNHAGVYQPVGDYSVNGHTHSQYLHNTTDTLNGDLTVTESVNSKVLRANMIVTGDGAGQGAHIALYDGTNNLGWLLQHNTSNDRLSFMHLDNGTTWNSKAYLTDIGNLFVTGGAAFNGASMPSWGANLNPIMLGGEASLYSYKTIYGTQPTLVSNFYYDGTDVRALQTNNNSNYPRALILDNSGSLLYSTSTTSPVSNAIVTDITTKFSVSKEGNTEIVGTLNAIGAITQNGTQVSLNGHNHTGVYQPLENQRLGTANSVTFAGVDVGAGNLLCTNLYANEVSSYQIYEDNTLLSAKYGRLASDNTWNEINTFNKGITLPLQKELKIGNAIIKCWSSGPSIYTAGGQLAITKTTTADTTLRTDVAVVINQGLEVEGNTYLETTNVKFLKERVGTPFNESTSRSNSTATILDTYAVNNVRWNYDYYPCFRLPDAGDYEGVSITILCIEKNVYWNGPALYTTNADSIYDTDGITVIANSSNHKIISGNMRLISNGGDWYRLS